MVVGFISISPSEMVLNSSGNPPASHTPRFTASATVRKMRVAVVEFAPGIADADHRLAFENALAEAFGAKPGAVRQAPAIAFAKPIAAAEFYCVILGRWIHDVLVVNFGFWIKFNGPLEMKGI